MRKGLRRAWQLFSVMGIFAGFFIGAFVLAIGIIPRVLLTRGETFEYRARRGVARGYERYLQLLKLMNIVDVHLDAGEFRGGSSVIVANHPSILDIVPLTARLGPICIVVGDRSARGFFFSLLWKLCGYIVVRDETLAGASDVMDEAVRRVRAGEALLIFPEGTRSPEGGILPFSRLAFDIAAKADAPVVPVSIRVSAPILKKGGSFFDWPEDEVVYEIRCHAPLRVGPGRLGARDARDATRKLLAETVEVRQLSAPVEGTPEGATHGA